MTKREEYEKLIFPAPYDVALLKTLADAALAEADEKLEQAEAKLAKLTPTDGNIDMMVEYRRLVEAEATIERLEWMLRTYLTQHEEGMDWDYGELPKLGSVEQRVNNTISYLERRWNERNG